MIKFLLNVPFHTEDDADNNVVSNLFNIVRIVVNVVNIVGEAIFINGNIETVSVDVARVIVKSMDGGDFPQIIQMDVDVVGGNINIAQRHASRMMKCHFYLFTNRIILTLCFCSGQEQCELCRCGRD